MGQFVGLAIYLPQEFPSNANPMTPMSPYEPFLCPAGISRRSLEGQMKRAWLTRPHPPPQQLTHTARERSHCKSELHGEAEFQPSWNLGRSLGRTGHRQGEPRGAQVSSTENPGGPAQQVGGTSCLLCFVLTLVGDQAWWLSLSTIDHPNSFRYFLSLAF